MHLLHLTSSVRQARKAGLGVHLIVALVTDKEGDTERGYTYNCTSHQIG